MQQYAGSNPYNSKVVYFPRQVTNTAVWKPIRMC